ncbi:MAG: hypothetical protein AAFQ01_04390, partial [Bacteroidota bacterium]
DANGKKKNWLSKMFVETNVNGVPLDENHLKIASSFKVIGMKNRTLVKYINVKDYDSEKELFRMSPTAIPINKRKYSGDWWVQFPPETVRGRVKGGQILTVEIVLLTEYKERIAYENRTIKPFSFK